MCKEKRTQVTCPDCGSGGASSYPCWCHVCDYKVLMLPSCNGVIRGNWSQFKPDLDFIDINIK